MRKLYKITALAIVLALMLSLTACSNDSIVGKWRYSFDMSAYAKSMSANMTEAVSDSEKQAYGEMFTAFDGVTFDMIMEFKPDGTYSFTADGDTVDAAQEKVTAGMKEALPKMYSALGVDLDAYLKQFNTTLDALVATTMQTFDFSVLKESDISGAYRLEGDKLYTTGKGQEEDTSRYLSVEVKADTLTITDVVGNVEGFEQYKNVFIPMEMTRVKE